MPASRDIVAASVPRDRLAAAGRAEADFSTFLDNFGIRPSSDSVTLYLTWLSEDGQTTGRTLRTQLQLLDLARRVRGEAPWTLDPDLRAFLRGLHHDRPLRQGEQRAQPLYIELVHAVVDATMLPSLEQHRATVAILLANETAAPASVIARCTWNDMRLRGDHVEVSLTRKIGRGPPRTEVYRIAAHAAENSCLVAAFRRLKADSPGGQSLFGDEPAARQRVLGYLSAIPARSREGERGQSTTLLRGSQLNRVLAEVTAPGPAQLRDRALLLIGYGAALRTAEATHLQQAHIQIHDQGLVLAIPGRRRHTAVPRAVEHTYDPVEAWLAWVKCMQTQGRTSDCEPAFRQISFTSIREQPLNEMGLNYLIHQRCDQANLPGHYTFTSLRIGMIRTALRANDRRHAIAAQADLTSLGSVQRHDRRESLLRRNVAGMLGL